MSAEDIAEQIAEPFEGFSGVPYLDPVGIPTIGYGSIWINGDSVFRVTMETPAIDRPTARQWLARELAVCAEAIKNNVTVALDDNQKAALEDFIYNLGVGYFASSTLLRKLNQGDYAGAADEFEKWDHAGGKVLAGLLRRRLAEKAFFNE